LRGQDNISGADNAVSGGQPACALPHAHHVVGDVTASHEQVLVRPQCGFRSPFEIVTKYEAIVHSDRHDRQARAARLLPIAKEIAEVSATAHTAPRSPMR